MNASPTAKNTPANSVAQPDTAGRVLTVGGFVPFTTVDFPGHLAAVVFCQGCPWRCRYCHNPHLQPFALDDPAWTWPLVLKELAARKGFLEAVVFSGGEPTAQIALAKAIADVKRLNFAVGLHTAGIFPDRLAAILPLVDWIGLDIKAGLDARYDEVTQMCQTATPARQTLELVAASGVPYELRTTVHPALHSASDIDDLAADLRRRGLPPTKIQKFRREGCVDAGLLAGGSPL